jgi:ABC-type Na+ transport system ATPase subunit NatA
LIHNPPVVLFDEPLEGMDANAAAGFKALMQMLAPDGRAVLYNWRPECPRASLRLGHHHRQG